MNLKKEYEFGKNADNYQYKPEVIQEELFETLQAELGSELASIYSNQLYETLKEVPYEQIQKKIYELFFEVSSQIYGPLVVSFVDRVLSEFGVYSTIQFLARDGIYMHYIAKLLVSTYPDKYDFKKEDLNLIYLTRNMFGIYDEIAIEGGLDTSISEEKKLLNDYLKQEGVDKNALLVDGGYYGSIIQKLFENHFDADHNQMPGAVFMLSKNPSITGYLKNNKFTNLLVDCLECLHFYSHESPGKLISNGGNIVPEILEKEYMSPVFATIQQAILDGYTVSVNTQNAVNHLLRHDRHVIFYPYLDQIFNKFKNKVGSSNDGAFSGVLPYGTPNRTESEGFIKNFKENIGTIGPFLPFHNNKWYVFE